MGMTDRQFEMHLTDLLRALEGIQKEIAKSGIQVAELDQKIDDIRNYLKRP